MVYNPLDQLRKYIKAAKKGQDWWAIAYALEESEDIKKILDAFENFKKSSIYPKRIADSLKHIQERVDTWEKKVKLEGDNAFCDINEKEWHLNNKRLLKLLKKEAKRLNL